MANESIDKILTELNKVELMLKQFQVTGKIPDIERDIVLAKLRNMYEFMHMIQLIEVEQPSASIVIKEPVETQQISMEQSQEITVELEIESGTALFEEVIEEVIEDIQEEPLQDVLVIDNTNKKTEETSQILAEKFRQDNKFINEALAKFQNLQDISKKYQTKPIKDISLAISLNDKFLYIKELFNNDGDLYKQTIEILNNVGDFNRAIQYLDESFHWDFNDFQVQKILELIHRRYMPSDE